MLLFGWKMSIRQKLHLRGLTLRRRTVFSFLILSLSILTDIFLHVWAWVSRYQNVSILDLIEAKDDGGGGGNWSYRTCKKLQSNRHRQTNTQFTDKRRNDVTHWVL